jgi:hypothetical protein
LTPRPEFRRVPLTVFGVPLTVFGVPLTVFGIPLTVFGVPLSVFGVPLSVFGVPLTNFGVPLTVFGVPLTILGVPLIHCDLYENEKKNSALFRLEKIPLKQVLLNHVRLKRKSKQEFKIVTYLVSRILTDCKILPKLCQLLLNPLQSSVMQHLHQPNLLTVASSTTRQIPVADSIADSRLQSFFLLVITVTGKTKNERGR